ERRVTSATCLFTSALRLDARLRCRAFLPFWSCRSTRMDAPRGPILFRCDGTFEKGWDPFYQCLSLAAAFQRRRRGTHFFSYLDPLSLATVINRGNNDWHAAEQPLGSPGDLDATLAQVRRLNAAAIVVAGDGMSADYLAEIRDTGTLVIAFDSKAGITFPVDV